jgi:TonB family protein
LTLSVPGIAFGAGNDEKARSMRVAFRVMFGLLLAMSACAGSAQEPIVRIRPIYPDAAVAQRITGQVTVAFTIGEGGVVQNLAVLDSSARVFDDAVIAAVQKWRYAEEAAGSSLSEAIVFTPADLEVELANRGRRSANPRDR